MFRSSNSVIPTGTDHRGGDDLRSGGTFVFNVCIGWVEIESECTARKPERAAGRPCPGAETPQLKPKPGLNVPPAIRLGEDVLDWLRAWHDLSDAPQPNNAGGDREAAPADTHSLK